MIDQPLEPIHRVYTGHDRKPCRVQLDDGTWVDAEIREWAREAEGHWTASVMWSRGLGQGNHLEGFPRTRVRAWPGAGTDESRAPCRNYRADVTSQSTKLTASRTTITSETSVPALPKV